MEESGTDTRARMIQLKARASAVLLMGLELGNMLIEPLMIVAGPGIRTVVLTQSNELAELTKEDETMAAVIADKSWHEPKGWRIVRGSSINYQGERVVYDCLAIHSARKDR